MKNKALIRFFETYLIFFLCVILMIVPTYFKYYGIILKQEHTISANMVQNGVDTFGKQILSLIDLSQTTYSDTRYRHLFVDNTAIPVSDYVNLNHVQTNFSNLIGTQSLVSDAGIIFRTGTILTRYRSFFNSRSYEEHFVYNNKNFTECNTLLKSNSTGSFLPEATVTSSDYDSYPCLTYVCGWPPNLTKSLPGIFYVTIKKQALLETLVPSEILEDGYVRIYDLEGNLLINHQYTTKKGFHAISYESLSTGLKVEVGIPNSLISKRLSPIRAMIFLYLVIMIIVGVMLASFFAYRSTNPIRQLVGIANRTHIEQHSLPDQNEYDFIADAITGLDQTIDTYAQTIEAQKSIIRIHIFEKALVNGLYNKDAYNEFVKFFPSFPESFCLAFLSFSKPDNNYDNAVSLQVSLLDDISANLTNDVYMQSYGDSAIMMTLPITPPLNVDLESWFQPLETLHRLLTEKYDMDFHIVISECFSDCRHISDAYSQIRNMSLLSDYSNSISICNAKDFPQKIANTVLDFNNMQQLYAALLVGDRDSVKSILDSSCKKLQSSGYIDEVMVKQVYYNIRNILLRIKLENYDSIASVYIPGYNDPMNIKQLFNELSECCENICSRMLEFRENSKTRFSNSVCEFINEHISNENLYTKMVASHFGISETTLQKIVRAVTGKSFFEYVEDLRLEKAYALLKDSNLTVNNISSECGFSSPNSFYKAFKRRYKQSPSTFRS
ncbi:MAG: AraC family transcriptional regulator [Bacillota bacterium]|nr:AraC family transcriptional regulator [Bacillota bacterium]